eukprot:1876078-Pleurochrysis_carterae.AAC.1
MLSLVGTLLHVCRFYAHSNGQCVCLGHGRVRVRVRACLRVCSWACVRAYARSYARACACECVLGVATSQAPAWRWATRRRT